MMKTSMHCFGLFWTARSDARLVLLLAVVTVAGHPGAFAQATSEQTREFRPRRVLPPRPPIVEPEHLDADDVDDEVTGNELVLGVVVGGQARAYPINMLTGPVREIITDRLGGRAIAATW